MTSINDKNNQPQDFDITQQGVADAQSTKESWEKGTTGQPGALNATSTPTGDTPKTDKAALSAKTNENSKSGVLNKFLDKLPTGEKVKGFFGAIAKPFQNAGKALSQIATDVKNFRADAKNSNPLEATSKMLAKTFAKSPDASPKAATPTATPTTTQTKPEKPPRPLLDAVKEGNVDVVKNLMAGQRTPDIVRDLKIAAGFARQLPDDKSSQMLAALNIREMPGPPVPERDDNFAADNETPPPVPPRDDEPARPTKPLPETPIARPTKPLPQTPQQLKPLPKEPRFGEALPPSPKKMVLSESLENVLGGANIAASPKQFSSPKQVAETNSKQLLAELKNSKTDIEKEAIISCLTSDEKDLLQGEIISRIKEIAPKREGLSPKRSSYNAEMTRLSELSQQIVNSGSNEAGVKTFLQDKLTELKARLKDEKSLSKAEIDSAIHLLARAEKKGLTATAALEASKLADRAEVQEHVQANPGAKEAFSKAQINLMVGQMYNSGQKVSSTIPLIRSNFNFIMNEVAATRPRGTAFNIEIGSGAIMDARRAFESKALLDNKLAAAKELVDDPIDVLLNKGIESQERKDGKNLTVFIKGNQEKINQGNLFSANSIISIGILGPIGKSYSETLQPAIIKTCERYIDTLDLPEADKKALKAELATLENNFKTTGDLTPLNAFISKISLPGMLQKAEGLVKDNPALQQELSELAATLKPGDDLTALHTLMSKASLPGLLEKAQTLVASAPPEQQEALQEKLDALPTFEPGDDLSPLVNFISQITTG
ncbi:MAG: hypothetical protein LLF94_06190 [Chlamydiales bacterium]|nr:hypothetical protein [Chlamydiales bacterium]